MAKFLRFIVNTIMIVAIVVAASLLIPPFAGVTTLIVDDIEMETNLAVGSVTYAWGVNAEKLNVGDKVLLQEESDMVYSISSVDGSEFVLEDTLSTDGELIAKELKGMVDKVVLTVPVLGYVSMALRTVEGLIIVGLSVVFVIILFILAEIWRKEEEEDWEEEEDLDEESEEGSEKKETEQKNVNKKEEQGQEIQNQEIQNQEIQNQEISSSDASKAESEVIVADNVKNAAGTDEFAQAEKALFEETSSFLASDIASMMGLSVSQTEGQAATESEALVVKVPENKVCEESKEKVLAMPLYSKEELMERAKAAGDEPELVMDELSGVTFLDYSDIL